MQGVMIVLRGRGHDFLAVSLGGLWKISPKVEQGKRGDIKKVSVKKCYVFTDISWHHIMLGISFLELISMRMKSLFP